MGAISPGVWLSADEAIDHVRACIWWKDGSWEIRLPLGMVARQLLRDVLGDKVEPVRAQGPLEVRPNLRAEWLLQPPPVAIPPTFWRDAVWDERDGFLSGKEELRWFEVSETDLHARWPVADRIPMLAPFDLDWPPLLHVIEAMTRCHHVSKEAALTRLRDYWNDSKLKASKGRGSYGRYSFKNWNQADPNAVRNAQEFRNEGGEPIVLWADDMIALEPRLVPLYSAWPKENAPPAPSVAPPASSSSAATAKPPKKKYRHNAASITELAGFLKSRQSAIGRTNREDAKAAAEAHFEAPILWKTLQAAVEEAGIKNPPGPRPRIREK
jgi:hypothetical protein